MIRKTLSGLLVVLLVSVFFFVAAGRLSWIYFWIVSAVLLVYVTYALPALDN